MPTAARNGVVSSNLKVKIAVLCFEREKSVRRFAFRRCARRVLSGSALNPMILGEEGCVYKLLFKLILPLHVRSAIG